MMTDLRSHSAKFYQLGHVRFVVQFLYRAGPDIAKFVFLTAACS
jgi:hypothetical protein